MLYRGCSQVFLSMREFVFSLQGTEVHRVLILLVKITLKAQAQADAQLCRTYGSVLESAFVGWISGGNLSECTT